MTKKNNEDLFSSLVGELTGLRPALPYRNTSHFQNELIHQSKKKKTKKKIKTMKMRMLPYGNTGHIRIIAKI